MNLRDSKRETNFENMRAHAEHKDPRNRSELHIHRQQHLPILQRIEDYYIYYRPIVDYYFYRFKKTLWTTIFALMFLGFVYIRSFVDERERFSDNTADIGAFTCALFALVSHLMSFNQSRIKQEDKKENKQPVLKNNRPYASDRRLLNQLLRNDLRKSMVQEQ